MATPPASPKDAGQVLRYAFDDLEGRLRVDAVISPDGHDLEIHYTDDSIAIGDPATDNILGINADKSITSHISDGTNTLKVNPDGSINVDTESTGGNGVTTYGEVTNVASGIHAIIVQYVAVAGDILYHCSASSDNNAEITIVLNNVVIDKKRTWYTNFNVDFEFDNIPLNAGDVVQIEGLHMRPSFGEFNARIQVVQD